MHRLKKQDFRVWLVFGLLILALACEPETTPVSKTAGHAGLKVKADACVSYFLGQCDEEPVLDFGEVAPGELASLWVRLDNVGETPLVFSSWSIESAPIDIRVTNSFNSDAGQGTMSVLPNRLEVDERLWVSIRLLPGLSPGPLPQETLKLIFEVEKSEDYEINFQLKGEITGCPTGYADCDNDMENGCEQDILSDVSHCGSCGNECAVPYGVASCVEGQCVFDCNEYYTGSMCDQDINECETNTHECDENATCSNRLEGYNCECNEGYEGDGFTCAPIPAKTDTVSAVTVVKAGDPLTVTCNVYDSWNGLMPPSAESWLEAPDGFEVTTTGTGVFSVKYNFAGVYSLKCHIREIVDDSPLAIQVIANDPHDWVIIFDDSDCQGLNSFLDFQVTVTDVYDNVIENPALSVVGDELDTLEAVVGGQYRWATEGDHRITFSVAEPHDPNAESLTTFFDVIIDETPPVIDITSPARAAMVEGSTSTITVSMDVIDVLTPVTSASLNEGDLTVISGMLVQNLSNDQNSNWGLNILRAQATDACDNERTVVQSYMYGESYYEAATSSNNNAKVTNGLIMQLNQDVFDDGNRADIDDLASLAQAAIQNFDLNNVLTNPVAHSDGFDSNGDGARDQQTFNDCGATCGVPIIGSCHTETHYEEGWWVTKTNNITYDAPIIEEIRATYEGLVVKMSVSNLVMPLNVFSNYKVTQCTSYEMDIAGDIRTDKIEIVGVMPIAMNGNELSTEFEELTIDISDINLDIDWSSWSWWDYILDNTVGEIANLIVAYFNDSIEETLEAEMRNSVEPLLGDFFQSISYGTEISLSPPLSGTLAIDAQLTYASVVEGYGRFGMQTQVRPSSKGTTIPEEAKGVLKSGHVTEWFSDSSYGFGLAFKTDFMNQIMWATWYGGGLDIENVESSMDLGEGVAIDLSTGLPPILMPSEDPDWDGTLGFGDIYVESVFELGEGVNVAVSLYLSGMVNFDLDFDPQQNQLSLVPSETANIWIEVVEISSPDLQADLSASLQEIFSSVFPELLTPILSSIPLPEFDVGGLAGLPESEIWKLTNGTVEKTEGQIRFTGALQ